ncbi:MAG: hypothetical protein JWM28_4066 [Chitinophagaceae bacterium]|nr:hypothetical protein [Chitinophagaceae bacterium]
MKFISAPARFLITLSVLTALTIFSCKKENSGATDDDKQEASLASAESNAEAEFVFNDVFDNVMGVNNDVGMQGTGVFGRSMNVNPNAERPNSCFTVSITQLAAPNIFPLQIVIDFGAGCEGKDGHIRKGKIIATYTGRLIVAGNKATVLFDGFYIDSIKVEGAETIANTTSAGNRQFTVDVQNAKLSKLNGNYTEWNNHKVITQTEGLATPDIALDDAFTVEGNSNGRLKRGNLLATWESNIDEPLVKKFLCRWVVQGVIKTTLGAGVAGSQWVAILDYGLGDCDNRATVIINGSTQEISLH